MKLSAILLACSCVTASAAAQPGEPPPSDAEVRAATAPEVILAAAREVSELSRRVAAAPNPVARVAASRDRWQAASSLAVALSWAAGRPAIAIDADAVAEYRRATGHPPADSSWALTACATIAAREHVLGEAARECLHSLPEPLPYYLQLAGWQRAFSEGTAEDSHRMYERDAQCVASRGPTACAVRLSAMQIELRDFAGAIATLERRAGADAGTNRAIAIFLGGDRARGFAELARVIADHPHAALAAFAYADLTALYVPAPVGEPQRNRAVRAALLYVCHEDADADLRRYAFRVRDQALQHAIAISREWRRPMLPPNELPEHSWNPRRGTGAAVFSCAELTRSASSVFGP